MENVKKRTGKPSNAGVPNVPRILINVKTIADPIAGISNGIVIKRMRFHLFIPLVAPASSSSLSTVARAPEINK